MQRVLRVGRWFGAVSWIFYVTNAVLMHVVAKWPFRWIAIAGLLCQLVGYRWISRETKLAETERALIEMDKR